MWYLAYYNIPYKGAARPREKTRIVLGVDDPAQLSKAREKARDIWTRNPGNHHFREESELIWSEVFKA